VNQNLINRFAKFPFITAAADGMDEAQTAELHEKMEYWSDEMGDRQYDKLLKQSLIWEMAQGTTRSAAGLFHDWLTLSVRSTERYERHLTELLSRVMAEGLTLDASTEQALNDRVSRAVTDAFRETAFDYRCHAIAGMDTDAGCAYLASLPIEAETQKPLRDALMAMESGKALLTEYFDRRAAKLAESGNTTYAAICAMYDESAAYGSEKLTGTLVGMAEKTAMTELSGEHNFDKAGKAFVECMEHLGANGDAETCEAIFQRLCDHYDSLFLHSFREEKMAEYKHFYENHAKRYPVSAGMCRVMDMIREKQYPAVLDYLDNELDAQILLMPDAKADGDALVEIIASQMVKHGSDCELSALWMRIAELKKKNLADFMVDNHIAMVYDAQKMRTAVTNDPAWTSEKLTAFQSRLGAAVLTMPNPALQATVNELTSLIKEMDKAEKKAAALARKQERRQSNPVLLFASNLKERLGKKKDDADEDDR